MNKEEVRDLFQDPLDELDEFIKEIEKVKKIINLIIENFDLLKDDVTDEQIGEVSSEINIKVSKMIAIIKDIFSDSKKLEAFIHEIKLLKRKRDKKLGKDDKENKNDFEKFLEEFMKNHQPPKSIPYNPYNPY